MILVPEDFLKLALAILLGGLIGAEREYRDKAAGFRTIIFICVGATIFTSLSLKLGGARDPVRIAANIVSGVGFLGAGAIMRGSRHITGLTTASTIWLAAALGMGIGGGQYVLSVLGTVAILIVLSVFPRIEDWIDNLRHSRTYEVTCPLSQEKFQEIERIFLNNGLRVRAGTRMKSGESMVCRWEAHGRPEDHERLVERLLANPDVKEFRM